MPDIEGQATSSQTQIRKRVGFASCNFLLFSLHNWAEFDILVLSVCLTHIAVLNQTRLINTCPFPVRPVVDLNHASHQTQKHKPDSQANIYLDLPYW